MPYERVGKADLLLELSLCPLCAHRGRSDCPVFLLLGVTLVLKRFSFIGDGLSHVAFGGMAIATVLGMSDHMPLTLAVTVACAVLLLHTGQNTQSKVTLPLLWCPLARLQWLSADESVLDLGESVWRCVQHPVRLYLDPDPDKIGSLALHRAFHHRGRSVYAVLQQDLCSHL